MPTSSTESAALAKTRSHLARHWQPVVQWLALLTPALAAVEPIRRQIGQWLPFAASPLVTATLMIAVSLAVFALVRYPRFAFAVTRFLYGQPQAQADVGRIFRGPRTYTVDDQATFPGRRTEIDDCWMTIEAQPFLIIEGESGSGKSSLLNAGLLPRARAKYHVVVSRVAEDPLGRLRNALQDKPFVAGAALGRAEDVLSSARDVRARNSLPLLVCLDQFEEVFVTAKDTVRSEFATLLMRGIEEQLWKIVIVTRTDFTDLVYALLREVDPSQRMLDIGSHYRIGAFNRFQAEAVLREMLAPIYEQDPGLGPQLDGFVTELIFELLRPPRDRRIYAGDPKSVLPVEMQIVGFALETMGPKNFSATLLRARGGKLGLLSQFLDDATDTVQRSTGVPPERALRILRQLVAPNGHRLQLRADEIPDRQGLSVRQIEGVLNAFGTKYLVNRLPVTETVEVASSSYAGVRYELMHDQLVPILVDAPDPTLQAIRSAETRLAFWTEQANATRITAEQSPAGRLRRLVRQLAWQPVPLIETVRLLRYASDRDDRQLLLRSLAGFGGRIALALLPIPTVILVALVALRLIYGLPPQSMNPPLAKYDPRGGYRFENLQRDNNSDKLFVILVFSGEGMQAAALSFGVLEALRDTKIRLEGEDKALLDEVDVIASNSGGSFPAAYYALYGRRIFEEFPKTFLFRDISGDLNKFRVKPQELAWLTSTSYGRAELFANFFDSEVFHGRTYADIIARRRRPFVILGATDIAIGAPFYFIQDQFDLLCSDLAGVSLARAVVASSLLSFSESSLAFRNYAGTCGYVHHPWVKLAANDRSGVNTRRTARARNRLSYTKPTSQGARPREFVNLTDGTATDITGVGGPLDAVSSANHPWSVLRMINNEKVERVVVIEVNSSFHATVDFRATAGIPRLVDTLRTAANNYSFDAMELMDRRMAELNEEYRLVRNCSRLAASKGARCALNLPAPPRAIEFSQVQVAPDFAAPDEDWSFTTNAPQFTLPRETIDKWRYAGRRWLEADANFKKLLRELGGRVSNEGERH